MFDIDTFLTLLYVMIDDFCQHQMPEPATRPGPAAALSGSETVTLSVFGQWARFGSERDFYRFAKQRLMHLFPTLPHRSQFSRLQRQYQPLITALGLHLAQRLNVCASGYEVLDRCGIATRWRNRRGAGWLPEYTDKGLCNRIGFFHGFHLLSAVSDTGVITGFGLGSASAKDQPLAETFFAARCHRDARLSSVGLPAGSGFYVLDKGFSGSALHQRWQALYQVKIVCAPQRDNQGRQRWPKEWRTWLSGLRQIVETVHDKLLNAFRLCRERPHDYGAFFARLSAKVALHNFCIYLNQQHGREPLQFADLLGW